MALEKKFERLKVGDLLVQKLLALGLEENSWWSRLVQLSNEDKDVCIQVRGSYLNVYCKMGNLLKIGLQGKEIVCKVHYKYLLGARKPAYIDATPSGTDIAISETSCNLVLSILEKENFRLIKQNIANYAGEEKQIQSKLVEKNRETLLDAEIAFNDSGALDNSEDGKTRIDLANHDRKRKALVFIELKQIFDARLYSDEINNQIAKYVAFATKHGRQLVEAYNDVIAVKKALGIIPAESYLASVTVREVEPRPILAIAASNQAIINAMRNDIEPRLTNANLAGLYFFGSDVDLNLKSDKNKRIFL